ncbi:hypothetical protein F7U66_11025 [Vibrio parahaemolyticus]|nr:hypothetical protein [Vibrio parahaemolyticus]
MGLIVILVRLVWVFVSCVGMGVLVYSLYEVFAHDHPFIETFLEVLERVFLVLGDYANNAISKYIKH